MAGFGVGTLPAVTFTALGIGGLRELSKNPRVRVIAGVSILAVAAASVLLPAAIGTALLAFGMMHHISSAAILSHIKATPVILDKGRKFAGVIRHVRPIL